MVKSAIVVRVLEVIEIPDVVCAFQFHRGLHAQCVLIRPVISIPFIQAQPDGRFAGQSRSIDRRAPVLRGQLLSRRQRDRKGQRGEHVVLALRFPQGVHTNPQFAAIGLAKTAHTRVDRQRGAVLRYAAGALKEQTVPVPECLGRCQAETRHNQPEDADVCQ